MAWSSPKKQREWKKANKDWLREQRLEYYKQAPEKYLEASRKWRKANPDKAIKSVRSWEERHPEKVSIMSLAKYRRHREEHLASTKRRYLKNIAHIKAQKRQKLYGITRDQFERMITEQGGRCAICHELCARLCVDHIHATGQIRGLLCNQCNFGIGHFHDDVETMKEAISYLRHHATLDGHAARFSQVAK